jgi:hypothetical protein
VAGLVADSAGLIQKRWADDSSIWSRLILYKVIGVNVHGETGIFAHLAERCRSGGGSGSSMILLLAVEAAGGGIRRVLSGCHFVRSM